MTKSSDDEEWGCCSKCSFVLLLVVIEVLLFGVLGVSIYWVIDYRGGFGWQDKPNLEFNLHPVLMIAGFIFLMGQGMLMYRACRCCRRIYNKLFHTIFHLAAMPAIAIACVAIYDFRDKEPYMHLYSLHSWIGMLTLGLFVVQFCIGFFSFLILLCCERSTLSFRAALVPLHSHFGIATFILAIACCITGITQMSFRVQGYREMSNENLVVNSLGGGLIVLGIVMTYVLRNTNYRRVAVAISPDD